MLEMHDFCSAKEEDPEVNKKEMRPLFIWL